MKNETQLSWLEDGMLTLNKCEIFLEVSMWIAAVSLVINLVNIIVITPTKLRKRLSYKLMLNLSISDAILDLVIVIYVGTLKAGLTWSLTGFYIITCIFQISGLVSLWTLIMLSFELFIRIIYPLKYYRLTKMTSFRGIIFYVWIISVIPYISLDMTVAAFSVSTNETVFHRAINDSFSPNCINSVCAILGVVLLLGLYAKIFRDIFLFTDRLQRLRTSLKRSAITICLVILAYVICFLPLWMYNFIEIIVGANLYINDMGFTIGCLSYILYATNTFLDPVIYVFRIPIIRNVYLQLWQRFFDR